MKHPKVTPEVNKWIVHEEKEEEERHHRKEDLTPSQLLNNLNSIDFCLGAYAQSRWRVQTSRWKPNRFPLYTSGIKREEANAKRDHHHHLGTLFCMPQMRLPLGPLESGERREAPWYDVGQAGGLGCMGLAWMTRGSYIIFISIKEVVSTSTGKWLAM